MKLERIKCKHLERGKDLCVSRSYIIGCTGQKAVVLDKQLNLVGTVTGLEYVYYAEVSPDETKLLLISNGNKFYIVDLQTFEKIRATVKAPFSRNLEGKGCWSFDGKSVWIPVQRTTGSFNSTLRRYPIEDLNKYEEHLKDEYCLTGISRMVDGGTYFLTGYNRQDNNRNYFIYFDGTAVRTYPLGIAADMPGPKASVDTEKGIVTVTTLDGCRQFTLDGKEIQAVVHPAPRNKTLCASEAFGHLFEGDAEKQEKLKDISAAFGLEEILVQDTITNYQVSACGSYLYLASQSGFYLLDAKTSEVLASVQEEYGVQNVKELAPGIIAIATWTGVKLYRILDS